MKPLLAMAALATVLPFTFAAVGSNCVRREENQFVAAECDAATEFCDAQRTCNIRVAGGVFPYWGCEWEGTCQVKQQLNMTCYISEDCASSVCRRGRCVECGSSTQCQQFQYCDIGVYRRGAPIPLEMVKKQMREERNNFHAKLRRFFFWWKDDIPYCDRRYLDIWADYSVWAEEMGNADRRNSQQQFGDTHIIQTPNGEKCRISADDARNSYKEMKDDFSDGKAWWWQPEGFIFEDATFSCKSKLPDNSPCLRRSECSSGYCEAGVCSATPPMCDRDVANLGSTGCPGPSASGSYICHGSWDVTLPNQCFEVRNCTSDVQCPSGQFCHGRALSYKTCHQCADGEREDTCGANGYCEFSVCLQKKVEGYCGHYKQCLSGQCNKVTNRCLPAGQLNPTFVGK